jgi:hypothetical protein
MTKISTRIMYLMLGLVALWFIPAVANAQVTITSVKVTVSSPTKTAVWCDTSLACSATGGVEIWNLGASGVAVGAGQTLVLAQTGTIPGVGGNFDTSDRATSSTPALAGCTPTDLCTVTVEINGILVYTSLSGNALNAFNNDNNINETSQWTLAASKPNYTLSLGYADNEHTGACPATGCFPNPFTNANIFIGHGNSLVGSCSPNCYDSGALLITGTLAPAGATGRMTGGGSVFTPNGTRVTHGFELHCDVTDVPNNLEINWPPANNFHLDVLASAVCTNNPLIHQAPPNAPFNTFMGTGTGKLNGVPGASIVFTLVDAGEPGTKDTAAYVIKDSGGNTVLTVPTAFLTNGNQQAHKDNN